eukprot:c12237_g1_i3.p1 GENE.c12237_g1_i3~~c12237_g1_i3.p1  ORF type:complete len:546 (-),score=134.21 c12237_g1_i3:71-1645(-)
MLITRVGFLAITALMTASVCVFVIMQHEEHLSSLKSKPLPDIYHAPLTRSSSITPSQSATQSGSSSQSPSPTQSTTPTTSPSASGSPSASASATESTSPSNSISTSAPVSLVASHELHPDIKAFVEQSIQPFPLRSVAFISFQSDLHEASLVWPVCIVSHRIYYRCPGMSCAWAFKDQFLAFLTAFLTMSPNPNVPDVCMWFNFADEPRVRSAQRVPDERTDHVTTCDPLSLKTTDSGPFNASRERVTSEGIISQANLPVFSIYGAPALGYTDLTWPLAFEYLNWESEYQNILDLADKVLSNPERHVARMQTSKCVWRGSATGGSRSEHYRQSPRWQLVTANVAGLDAKLTSVWSNDDAAGLTAQFPSTLTDSEPLMRQFQQHECIIDIDGNAGSQRFKQLLLSPLVVLKVSSPYPYFWSHAVKAWKHYVPVCADLSNLAEAIEWVHTHSASASEIAREATLFARQHLSLRGVHKYMEVMLQQYALRLNFVPGDQDLSTWKLYEPDPQQQEKLKKQLLQDKDDD